MSVAPLMTRYWWESAGFFVFFLCTVEILHFGWRTVQVGKLINSEKKSVNRGGGPVWYKSKCTPGFLHTTTHDTLSISFCRLSSPKRSLWIWLFQILQTHIPWWCSLRSPPLMVSLSLSHPGLQITSVPRVNSIVTVKFFLQRSSRLSQCPEQPALWLWSFQRVCLWAQTKRFPCR